MKNVKNDEEYDTVRGCGARGTVLNPDNQRQIINPLIWMIQRSSGFKCCILIVCTHTNGKSPKNNHR